jgi:hypothetical protein
MQKERLFISTEKVRVEYEFLNDTDQDIVTEVAFPIPEYNFMFDDPGGPVVSTISSFGLKVRSWHTRARSKRSSRART